MRYVLKKELKEGLKGQARETETVLKTPGMKE